VFRPAAQPSAQVIANAEQVVLSGKPSGLLADAKALTRAAWRLSPGRFTLQGIFLVFGGFIGGVSLLLLIPIINSVAKPDGKLEVPGVGSVSIGGIPLWALLTAFVLLTLIQGLIQRASAINSARFQPMLVDTLRHQAFVAVLDARWTFVLGRRKTDIIAIVTAGASRCGAALQQLLTGAVGIITALVTAAVAFWVAPGVTAIALVGVLILAGIQVATIRPSYRLGVEFSGQSRNLQAVMQDSLDSLRLVRAHHASAVWVEQLADAFTVTREVQVEQARRTSTISVFSSVALAAAAAALVQVSVWMHVPATSIVVILLLVARLARQVQGLVGTGAQLANSLPAVQELAELTTDARAAVEVPPNSGTRTGELSAAVDLPLIAFRDVTYTYPNSDNGVRGICFTVPRGDITVLVGPSGAGKSTTADLALGLLEPESGAIEIDGTALTAGDLPWWRSHVAYVPQETVLVPGSLRENLVWSVPGGATDAQCWEALDRAAADFARDLPDGLDTVLGDRGIRLSGGERQRVAIARALLRTPALLVLDEATSSLDDDAESAVIGLMTSLAPHVTVLMIAHRQSTIDAASYVVHFDDGRVLGTTTHAAPGPLRSAHDHADAAAAD